MEREARPARNKVLFQLKTLGPQTAAQLAAALDVTPMAVRQHLAVLEEEGLVAAAQRKRGVGRPPRVWMLRPEAECLFPDGHQDLSAAILTAARDAFGEDGLRAIVERWTSRERRAHEERLAAVGDELEARVAALAELRREAGYMADWQPLRGGGFSLVENHCAICAAARTCRGFCEGELEVFRAALGPRARVERVEHLLDGDRRCAYEVREA